LDDLLIKGYHESLERDLSEREPLSPQYILEIIWRHCDSLASYAQHDAHEFFITFVNVLRQHMMTGMNKEEPTPYSRNILSKQPNKEEEEEARGWLDDLFSGVLESHVYCASCKRYSATLEDYFDISLDLNSSEDSDGTRTLQECLTWFTSPEELDNGTSRYCEYCQQHTSFYKRVAFHKLPQVLCFHLKRFQHGLDGKGVSSKVESEIGFPIHGLDMSPYISSQILEETRVVEETLEDGIATKKPPQDDDDDEEQQRVLSKEDMLYDLYAVVNHIGKIDHGHYITWIREQNSSWFKCDDEVVEESLWTKDNVAQSCQAYLLFYIARNVA
jgi:ubiquitin carboxyl-terminal hydrolase 22/27/51